MINFQHAVYAKHSNGIITQLNDNPLTEALRQPLPAKDLVRAISYNPLKDQDSINELDNFYRYYMIDQLRNTFLPHPELLSLYNTIVLTLLSGYTHRNPLEQKTKQLQYRIATDPDFKISNVHRLAHCIPCIGVSGTGKTLSLLMILSQIPQVIRHTHFNGQDIRLDQITWLSMEAPSTKTKKGFILNFLAAIDEIVGTSYFEENRNTRESVSTLLAVAKKAAFSHCLGLVFIDEIQRCVNKTDTADKATLEFIDSFFNAIGVPFIIAGTYAARPLFRDRLSTGRRLSSGRSISFNPINKSNPFWNRLVQYFYHPAILKKPFEFDKQLTDFLHDRSVGVPDILSRLIKLSYEQAIESGEERITADLVNDVYRSQFKIIHPALEALRKGRYGQYEDLADFDSLDDSLIDPLDDFMAKNLESPYAALEDKDDLGLHIELSAETTQTVIPSYDLRNLSGVTKQDLIKSLIDRKSN